MTKKEFEEQFCDIVCPFDLAIKGDVDELWQWIEQQIKQARIDECHYWEKEFRTSNYPNRRKIQIHFRDRIKQLRSKL